MSIRNIRNIFIAPGLVLFALVSACASPNEETGTPTGPEEPTATTTTTSQEPWWEGRTWAGEIDVCVDATDDVTGCQMLAGLLIHRRCELKTYQTFVAALIVGSDFETLYDDASAKGDCEKLSESEPEITTRTSRLGQLPRDSLLLS